MMMSKRAMFGLSYLAPRLACNVEAFSTLFVLPLRLGFGPGALLLPAARLLLCRPSEDLRGDRRPLNGGPRRLVLSGLFGLAGYQS